MSCSICDCNPSKDKYLICDKCNSPFIVDKTDNGNYTCDTCHEGKLVNEISNPYGIYRCNTCRFTIYDKDNKWKCIDSISHDDCPRFDKGPHIFELIGRGPVENSIIKCPKCKVDFCYHCLRERFLEGHYTCPSKDCNYSFKLITILEIVDRTPSPMFPIIDNRSELFRNAMIPCVPTKLIRKESIMSDNVKSIIEYKIGNIVEEIRSEVDIQVYIDFMRTIYEITHGISSENLILRDLIVNRTFGRPNEFSYELLQCFEDYCQWLKTNDDSILSIRRIGYVGGRCEKCNNGKVVRYGTECSCEKCGAIHCHKCFQLINGTHECKKEVLELVSEFGKGTILPCPWCGVITYREMYCSLMWCKKCHHFFDIVTGEKINRKALHNADFIDYLTSIGRTLSEVTTEEANGANIRPRNDIHCGVAFDELRINAIHPLCTTLYQTMHSIEDILNETNLINKLKRNLLRLKYNKSSFVSDYNSIFEQMAVDICIIREISPSLIEYNTTIRQSIFDLLQSHSKLGLDELFSFEVLNIQLMRDIREMNTFFDNTIVNELMLPVLSMVKTFESKFAKVLFDDTSYLPHLPKIAIKGNRSRMISCKFTPPFFRDDVRDIASNVNSMAFTR